MKRIVLLIITALLFIVSYINAEKKTPDSIVNKEVKVIRTEIAPNVKDSILYSKLSAEQLLELKRQENETEIMRIESRNNSNMPLGPLAIVTIVLMPFLFVLLILLIQGYIRDKEAKRKYDLYMKSLEMGQSIPEHFFDEPKKANPVSNLKKGILWFVVGLALLIYFLVVKDTDALIVGIVPTFIGIGYLVVHLLDKPKRYYNDEQNG